MTIRVMIPPKEVLKVDWNLWTKESLLVRGSTYPTCISENLTAAAKCPTTRTTTSTRETLELPRLFPCSARRSGRAALSWLRWTLLCYELDIDLECIFCQNRPCKIVEMSTSKTGKHGHAKVHLVALDIFTGGNETQPLKGIFYFRQEAGGHMPLHSQHGGNNLDLLLNLLYF